MKRRSPVSWGNRASGRVSRRAGRGKLSVDTIILRQHFGPAQVGEYIRLPFDVPPTVARIDVQYSYDRAVEPVPGAPPGNAIDIGLYDPRGADFGRADGFRGWSGTARQQLSVAPGEATPGYLPGPLYPGRWWVELGLYMIHPAGCDCEITIRLTRGAAPEVEALSWPAVAGRQGRGWYRGDLHCHSHHSEATGTLADLLAAARDQGLDYLAVTEHNTTSHHRLLGQFRTADFLPIAGEEITTYHGHANVWGADRWIDFRCRGDADLVQVIRLAHEAGGLFSANHPKTNGPPWLFGTFAGIDCLEVWQGPWFLSNYQVLPIWDSLLRQGRHVAGVGGSDEHQPSAERAPIWHRVGQPTTWVHADRLEQESILRAIKAGHVFISAGPEGPRLELWAGAGRQEAMMGDTLSVGCGQPVRLWGRVQAGAGLVLRLVGPQGILAQIPIEGDDQGFEHALLPEGSTYVRAELAEPVDPADAGEPAALFMQALGNPIYVETS